MEVAMEKRAQSIKAFSAAQSPRGHLFMAFGARGKQIKGGSCACSRRRRIENGDHGSVLYFEPLLLL